VKVRPELMNVLLLDTPCDGFGCQKRGENYFREKIKDTGAKMYKTAACNQQQ
jgi:hypothetical protein